MKIHGIIWLRNVVDKLAWKHNVTTDEVESVFNHSPHYRFIENGDIKGENLYAALGRTEEGRYLIVSARDMTRKERKIYARK